jgi:hypothetical protein
MDKKFLRILKGRFLVEMSRLVHGPASHSKYYTLGLPLIDLLEKLKSDSQNELYDIYFELFQIFVDKYLTRDKYSVATYLASVFIHYRDNRSRLPIGWTDIESYQPNS